MSYTDATDDREDDFRTSSETAQETEGHLKVMV